MGSTYPPKAGSQPGDATALPVALSVLALALAAGAPQARAAAIERTVPSTVRILFEDGLYGGSASPMRIPIRAALARIPLPWERPR